MAAKSDVNAWRPRVSGVEEVLHAHFVDHAYPQHIHDSWTLLIVDSGAISYDLAGHERSATQQIVTLLPPQVPHDGRAASASGFHKRVLYLENSMLEGIGSAVDSPGIADPQLRNRIRQLHVTLAQPGNELEAQSRLAFIVNRVQEHLRNRVGQVPVLADAKLAHALRDLIDGRIAEGILLDEAAKTLHAGATHLIRSFTKEFGIAPHQYLINRRVQIARRLLLEGQRPVDVATAAGFHDQAHLNRHFKRIIGTTPARFAHAGLGRFP